MQETRLREEPLEKEMTARAGILAWEIPRQRSLGATVHSVTKSQTKLSNRLFFLITIQDR